MLSKEVSPADLPTKNVWACLKQKNYKHVIGDIITMWPESWAAQGKELEEAENVSQKRGNLSSVLNAE